MADPWWGGALIYVSWTLYEFYGDTEIILEAYPSMKKYMDFLETHSTKNLTIQWDTLLGDWLEVGAGGSADRTPREITATLAFYFYSSLMIKFADIIKNESDKLHFIELASKIKKQFNSLFLDEETGMYAKDSQSTQAMALLFEIVPNSHIEDVLDVLTDNIINVHDGHLSTGIVGTYFLYQALSRFGCEKIAYDIITAKGFPGFEYMINNDNDLYGPNTTLWEDWPGVSSLCHPVQGCVVSYFYETLAGIKPCVAAPGFKLFYITPFFIDDLDDVKAQFETYYGTILSEWNRNGSTIELKIKVPINTCAIIKVPANLHEKFKEKNEFLIHYLPKNIKTNLELRDNEILLGSGEYKFHYN